MESFTIEFSDIPQDLYDSIAMDLFKYTVGLIAVKDTKGGEDVKLIGSGTFIKCGDSSGILTAQHVSNELRNADLGLVVSEVEHKPVIQRGHLSVIEFRGRLDSEGPDLSFINIPSNLLWSIKAKKSIYNLESNHKYASQQTEANDIGIWFICGFPDEFTKSNERSTRGFDEAKGFSGICGAVAGIDREFYQEGYDYYEISVGCGVGNKTPTNYGGVSGGGLWHVPLLKKSQKILSWGTPFLAGVAFYQTDMFQEVRKLKCHGKQSIYSNLLREIKKHSQPGVPVDAEKTRHN
jgi:hypothetical protein